MHKKRSLFLFEFAKCTAEEFDESTGVEGYAMFKAMHNSFRDADFNVLSFEKEENYVEKFRNFANAAEFSLCIAPESENLLYILTGIIEKSNSENLGSNSSAVKIAGDKLRTAQMLKELSPKTFAYKRINSIEFPFIAKPRYGAGGDGIFFIRNEKELKNFLEENSWFKDYIFQEYIKGIPCSASLILNRHGKENAKIISTQLQFINNFKYCGTMLPFRINKRNMERIIKASEKIKGLHGYVGVDFIIEENSDEAKIIEINPRITTSAVAIAYAIGFKNFAEIIIKNHLADNFDIPEIKKRIKIEKKRKRKGLHKFKKKHVFAETENFEIVVEKT